MNDIDNRADAARTLVRQAGRRAWEHFERGVAVETKADFTPVTIADRETESILRAGLAAHFPNDGFLGEEHGSQPGTSGFLWIIDPIDATKNFVRGIPIFATLVGLERDGEMVAGFAYVPALDRLYHAVKGGGAFCNEREIRVSTIDRIEDALLCYSSIHWFDRSGTSKAFLDLARQAGRTRGFGDFYGYLLVAEGSADIMLEPMLSPWDIAALVPIIQEAGGICTDCRGEATIRGAGMIAANPALHPLVLERMRAP